ncbi:MAG: hypothetical protein NVSMB29_12400 [Candidatus Dormibacteria bacterium]
MSAYHPDGWRAVSSAGSGVNPPIGLLQVTVATTACGLLAACSTTTGPTGGSSSCCAPQPPPGELTLQSYDFPVTTATGSLSMVLGIFKPQGVVIQQVFLDSTALTSANSGLRASCGQRPLGTFIENACTISVQFGPGLAPPPPGSTHTVKVVEHAGAAWSFRVQAGALNQTPGTS